jgi:CubicO group peptidase (beta-lactamase class C family)
VLARPKTGASMNFTSETSTHHAERIRRIENHSISLPGGPSQPSIILDLKKLMEIYKVPGISVAVIDRFEIAWAKGYGVRELGTNNPVTPQTIFESGSVSKPVAAMGALALVEQGRLSLDEDINQKLTSWKVPENEFTREQKVTLRRILSHTAGLTVHGFPGYDIDETVPTVIQILNGEPPANTEPVRVDILPGTKWRYAGGGTTVAQQLMVDVARTPFPQLMRELVFDRLGMNDSTYEQPLPTQRHTMAASGTSWDGKTVHGKWHIYPEMAAAGLWSTPSDLARVLIEIALSRKGMANNVLTQSMAQEMLTSQTESPTEFLFGKKENPARMGLGFFLGDETHPNLFGHTGDDEGFEAVVIMNGVTGQGAAVMTNSQFGGLLADTLIDAIAWEYGWENYVPAERPRPGISAALMEIARLRGPNAALEQYQILKDTNRSGYALDEYILLIFGYLLLADNRPEEALEVFKLEVKEYPDNWNVYDTLAELYTGMGEKQLAIQNYEKSIELNPDNQNAAERLKELKGQ